MIPLEDTIAALASAQGPAARGIVRVSGTGAAHVVQQLFSPVPSSSSRPTRTSGVVRIAGLTTPLPADLYLWPTRRSFTGQPLAELHTIGSPPILEALLADLFAHGVRPAQPGEFTLRAFLAGRIDLTQAEAVLGVIDARDEHELQTALNQMAGGLSSQILRLRGDLLDLLADLEAGLDFADEAIEFVSQSALLGRLASARDSVADMLRHAAQRMRLTTLPRVVLAGPPNAGKSTLFNALTGQSRALVSAEAGTTRDYLAATVELGGLTVEMIDTAGRMETAGGLERQAQELGREQIERADLVIWCRAADQSDTAPIPTDLPGLPPNSLWIVTKGDLDRGSHAPDEFVVSALSRSGLAELCQAIAACLSHKTGDDSRLLGSTAARSFDSLNLAHAALERAVAIARHESDQELLAIEVRETLGELGKIAGVVYTDDILDRIFSKFCIGK